MRLSSNEANAVNVKNAKSVSRKFLLSFRNEDEKHTRKDAILHVSHRDDSVSIALINRSKLRY
jgi:hypothetical protein